MSLSLLDNILLRSLVDPVLTTKGSELSWDEEDTNFVILHNAVRELSLVEVGGVDAYNAGTEYSLTSPATYVTYNGNTWQYINAIPQTGVTPGTNGTVWSLASNGIFSHQQNTDTYLNFGGANQVSAADLRGLVDAGIFDPSDLLPLDGSRSMTSDLQFTSGNKGLLFNSTSYLKDNGGYLKAFAYDAFEIESNNAISLNAGQELYIGALGLSASTVPYLDSSQNLKSSLVTPTELGYVHLVTSPIQTQIDSKQATLISGTTIKTINSTSLLGSGDIVISGSVADGDKGDITVSSSGTVWTIDAGAVSFSKLATLTSGNILVGNVSNVAASVAMSGDITISNAGATTIGANAATYTKSYNGTQLAIVSAMKLLTGN